MSAAVANANQDNRKSTSGAAAKAKSGPIPPTKIPDVVEERRKDSDGRVFIARRFAKGKILGKVSAK